MSHTSTFTKPIFAGLFTTLGTTLSNGFEDLQMNVSSFILHAQLGQLKRALLRMTDHQLAEVGITRTQINAHAEKLMNV